MLVKDVLRWLNELAPFESAEDFDNVGLLLGDENAPVTGVTFGLDVCEALIAQAVEAGANLIVTHHPFIFQPLKRIEYTAPQGRLLCELTQRRLNVVAAHTNWDKACGGVGDTLAAALGLQNVQRGDDYLRVGDLPSPMTESELSHAVEAAIHTAPRLYGKADEPIRRVAVGGGSYGGNAELALALGAQAYLIGEIHHHDIIDACGRGLLVLDGGHYATEAPGIATLYQRYLSDAPRAGFTAPARLCATAPYRGATLC